MTLKQIKMALSAVLTTANINIEKLRKHVDNEFVINNKETDGKIVEISNKIVGEKTTGNIYILDKVEMLAEAGAEIFNDYENNKAVGKFSHAEGEYTEASGASSHAEGFGTKASGASSHAEGFSTKAYGDYSHAEGFSTEASGASSHAEGSFTKASGNYSHAEGFSTKASGDYSHAEGQSTTASGIVSHVQGKFNIEDTEKKYAHIVGNGKYLKPSNAHTLDWKGNAWYQGDVYVGSTSGVNRDKGSKKLATEDFVNEQIGNVSPVQSDWNQNDESELDYIKNRPFYTTDPVDTVIMEETTVSTWDSWTDTIYGAILSINCQLVLGQTYTVVWDGTTYENLVCFNDDGYKTIGAHHGDYSVYPFGIYTTNTSNMPNDYVGKLGIHISSSEFADDNTSVSHTVSIIGQLKNIIQLPEKYISYKPGLKVEGKTFTIDDEEVTAGVGAEIFNDYEYNTATGNHSHAEGTNTIAFGNHSHAEGYGTTTFGIVSHTEGTYTIASGDQSHAEGNSTTASGIDSHAEGNSTTASGDQSHAEGNSTTASGDYQHVQGKFNIEDTENKYAHIVGNGKYLKHSNAHTLDWNGNAEFQGDVKANACGGANPISLVNIDNVTKNIQTQLDNIQTQLNSKPTIQLTIWEEND